MDWVRRAFLFLFDSEHGARNYLISRWLFLRALGLIYFSAFFALLFQVRGLIGAHGILSAAEYLDDARSLGAARFLYVPSLLWISSSDHMLMTLMWVGLIASVLLVANIWPRAMLLACFLCFLSFVSAAQDFSGYQSDSMLLEAGFLSLFLAPGGLFPGWGAARAAARAASLLLLWEWFRIYFESGVVKLLSGDPTWRNLTAMYEYYQNGPLPTWIGWYVQHLPHWFHKASAGTTLAMELLLVWMAFLPRRWRIACFFIVTAWQIVVIATANYTFLNYLVLVLAVLLLDDEFLRRFVPERWRSGLAVGDNTAVQVGEAESPEGEATAVTSGAEAPLFSRALFGTGEPVPLSETNSADSERPRAFRQRIAPVRIATTAIALTWIFYATAVLMIHMLWREEPLPAAPVALLEPFRIANQYGLFAVMTPHRYEIEFQGSNDGQTWVAYPFRYKPQDVHERPGIYAPYQPRFDWNLWFASLGSWLQYPLVPRTQELLLENDGDVLNLFAGNPFPGAPPKYVRSVLWQYWFSTPDEKRQQGIWWTRQYLGTYAPTLTLLPDGRYGVVAEPSLNGPPEP
jgi:hypothetical protein